jgi:hypothetical protein
MLLGVAVVVAVFAVGALAFASSRQVAFEGDPHHVSAGRLRDELKQGGVRVRYLKPVHEPVPSVVGVASVAPARGIGFEYQVFPSSDETTVAQLGKLKEADFGWPKAKPGVVFEPVVRGVLGNIAYAIYERHFLTEKGTRKEAMRLQLATQRVLRTLDDALFESFPDRDPYANALSPTP